MHDVYAFGPGATENTVHPPDLGEQILVGIPTCGLTNSCGIDTSPGIIAPLYAFSNPVNVGYISARLTSVTEPSTLLLLGSGLIGVAMLGKKRLFR
ncbi:MAG TPA: hypothetical protein DCR39_00920 [Nitrospiraceae bacterium]|nr:hypothetical protein [Nitrospiraceae bacterium]